METLWEKTGETIGALPGILWGVIVLIGIYLALKHVLLPRMAQCHEKKMKKMAFEQEMLWHQERQNAGEKQVLSVDEQVKDLQAKLSDKERKLQAEKDANELLKKQLEFYKDFLDKLIK